MSPELLAQVYKACRISNIIYLTICLTRGAARRLLVKKRNVKRTRGRNIVKWWMYSCTWCH